MRSETFSVRDLLIRLLREKGIREGHWELSVNFAIRGVQAQNAPQSDSLPGLVLLVSDVVLAEKEDPTPASVDASTLSE